VPKKILSKSKKFRIELVSQMLTLATAGFGLVAALAWNNFIQELVKTYINKWFPGNGGIISLLIYAVIVTLLAVTVTYQLSKLKEKIEN